MKAHSLTGTQEEISKSQILFLVCLEDRVIPVIPALHPLLELVALAPRLGWMALAPQLKLTQDTEPHTIPAHLLSLHHTTTMIVLCQQYLPVLQIVRAAGGITP